MMSGYYDHAQTGSINQNYQDALQEIPEDEDFQSQYSNVDPNQNYPETVARWFQHDGGGDGEESITEQKPPQPKPRRRVPPGPDHVKHRRTRSGCYTCRTRRVKCDETHPICERCKKGSRECNWPTEPSGKSSSSKTNKQTGTETDSSELDEDEDDITQRDEQRGTESGTVMGRLVQTNLKSTARKKSRGTLSSKRGYSVSERNVSEKSMSPATPDDIFSPSGHHSIVSTNTSLEDAWANLKDDHHFYLTYHQQNLSYCFYFLKQDRSRFIKTTLIETALTYQPLLYAVVGFAAFQYALKHEHAKLSSFLNYYNKAVSLLRKDLISSAPYTNAMVYTILQLATFEEYMGDWANLMLHHKAAFEVIKTLYTPETIAQSETSRTLFAWYIRMDVLVSLMAGQEPLAGFEWFKAYSDRTRTLTRAQPDEFDSKVEALNAQSRMIGLQMAALLAKFMKGDIAKPDFMLHNSHLAQVIEEWKKQVINMHQHKEYLVYDFGNKRELGPEDVADLFQPGVIFDSEHFAANFLMMDVLGVEISHKMQTATVLGQSPPVELTELSLKQCQIYEAIQEYDGAPPGMFLPAQVNIGLVCLFIPRDDKHITWCRKMLARFENNGYIYPPSFRAKVADGWSMPSIKKSWLPDDREQPQIVKELRAFVDERKMEPQNQLSEDIRSMKAILEKLHLEESPKNSPENSSVMSDSTLSPTTSESTSQTRYDKANSSWYSG